MQPLSDQDLAVALDQRRAQHLYRSRLVSESPQGPLQKIQGKQYLSFCSNDYLGLANHPKLVEEGQRALAEWGVGSGAAHLVNGHSSAHHALEEELAEFTGRPRALLFSTGYMANLGVITALCGRGDRVIQDRLNHASLVDAGLLSRAKLGRYAHSDPEAAAAVMPDDLDVRSLLVTDGVFSMDGDLAPLPALAELAHTKGAWLMVDDAHGLGVVGTRGRGSLEHFGLNPDQVPVLMGTLGKGLGCFGAFVAGSEALIETLIQQARSYIYTTALPPAVAAAARMALKLVDQEPERRDALRRLVEQFRCGAKTMGCQLMASDTPIQPILIGDSDRAIALSAALRESGILITAIRPPTVPQGGARLRVTLSAAHSSDQVDRLLEILEELKPLWQEQSQ